MVQEQSEQSDRQDDRHQNNSRASEAEESSREAHEERLRRLCGYARVRVGEASHPGPALRRNKKNGKQFANLFEMLQVLLSLATQYLGPEKMNKLLSNSSTGGKKKSATAAKGKKKEHQRQQPQQPQQSQDEQPRQRTRQGQDEQAQKRGEQRQRPQEGQGERPQRSQLNEHEQTGWQKPWQVRVEDVTAPVMTILQIQDECEMLRTAGTTGQPLKVAVQVEDEEEIDTLEVLINMYDFPRILRIRGLPPGETPRANETRRQLPGRVKGRQQVRLRNVAIWRSHADSPELKSKRLNSKVTVQAVPTTVMKISAEKRLCRTDMGAGAKSARRNGQTMGRRVP